MLKFYVILFPPSNQGFRAIEWDIEDWWLLTHFYMVPLNVNVYVDEWE